MIFVMDIGSYSETLKHRGLKPFLCTQFLGALNDNIYKMVVSLLAANLAVTGGGATGYLSMVAAVFILPFLLFSGYAGHVADVYSKRDVLVVMKAFEIVAMGLGLFAFIYGHIEPMMGVVFLMAVQSTFFSPAKYGILPETLPDKDLSRANGLLEMSTFAAIILGTWLGGEMLAVWQGRMGMIGFSLLGVAIAGTLTSLRIAKVPSSGARRPFQINPWATISGGMKWLKTDRSLWYTVIGISYFWFLGALMQLAIILFGKEVMALDDRWVARLEVSLAVGIAAGSLAAGYLSGSKIELGLVPLGSIGMGVFGLLLSSSGHSYFQASTVLMIMGFSGGLFVVPLYALLQQQSPKKQKGQLIATANFVGTLGILLASGALWGLRGVLEVPVDQILLLFGLLTLFATVCVVGLLPDLMIRLVLWMLTHSLYRIRVVGDENLPLRGPALLVSNHMSYMEGLLIGASTQRVVRFIILRDFCEAKGLQWFSRLMKTIPIPGQGRKAILDAFDSAGRELRQGHLVCIFAEGRISRSGNLLPFKRGFKRVVEGMEAPVIPVHLDRLGRSPFSPQPGRAFLKWPERLRYPVTVCFGPAMPRSPRADQVRQAVMELGSAAAVHRRFPKDQLHLRFIKAAKRRLFSMAMADSGGRRLTYWQLLAGSLSLARWVRSHCREQYMVGLLLPSSVAGAVTNVAVLLAGKVPVNLNFTAGRETLEASVEQCALRSILTSRLFVAKAKIQEMEGMVFLEDVMKEIGALKKLSSAINAFMLPSVLLRLLYTKPHSSPDDLATVIFSSGSTARPKGIMLSHHNILSNVEAVEQIFGFTPNDRIMGILPLFHSFGFTGTLWLPLLSRLSVVYHANPMDVDVIGKMVSNYKATVLISTPTFCSMYIRKCTREEFASLRIAVVGAEALPRGTAEAFKEKYGLDLLEGYGCTEMGPVVSVNVPDFTEGPVHEVGLKPGTVGRPIPGVAVKVVDPENGRTLQPNEEGILWVKGPGMMNGYLGSPKETEQVIRDGWYVTSDMASMDEDGFITITGRVTRFSKIAGEMIPHIRVEQAVSKILGESDCVVTALPDEQKGERLVVLYTNPKLTPRDLWKGLRQTKLPPLWIPKAENMFLVDGIPLLGSGKLDLAKAKQIALEKVASAIVARGGG